MAKFRDLAHEVKKDWSSADHALYERASQAFEDDASAQIALGKELAEERAKRQLSQGDLALLTGIQQSEISRIERGVANPTTATVARLAKAFDKHLTLAG